MARTFRDDLEQKLQDPEFAKMFGAAQAKSSFAITLAEARRQLNLTQQKLASRLGVSQGYIAKLEGGEANPTLERIGSLLAIIGLSLTTGTTALSPYPELTSWESIWAYNPNVRAEEIKRERDIAKAREESLELEEITV
jgi:transcriptional regulator with XRE-family HTH domain